MKNERSDLLHGARMLLLSALYLADDLPNTATEQFESAKALARLAADKPRYRFRAIRWGRCSGDFEPVPAFGGDNCGWHDCREDAVRDAVHRYAPYERWTYEIECSDGSREDLSGAEHDRCEQAYADAMAHRDAVGVWG